MAVTSSGTKQDTRRQIDTLLANVEELLIHVREAQRPFLRSCRRILDKLSANRFAEPFIQPVSGVRGYSAVVAQPMCLSQVRSNLLSYATPQQFVDDLRLIVSNCYAFNGEQSELSTAARELELAMEDMFVGDLRLPRPNPAEISTRCRGLNGSTRVRLMELVCLYEKMQPDAKAFQFTPDALRTATVRVVVSFLRGVSSSGGAGGVVGDVRASALEGRRTPAPTIDAARMPISAAAAGARVFQRPPVGAKRPAASVDGDDDLFHEVAAAAPPPLPPRSGPQQQQQQPQQAHQGEQVVPLEQNVHHVGFVNSVSPMHSPTADSSDAGDKEDSNPFAEPLDF